MFKKIVFLSLHLAVAHSFAMVKSKTDKVPVVKFKSDKIAIEDMRPWVQETTLIYIESTKLNYTFTIQDKTTISDIKKYIHHIEGIPVEQQTLSPIWKSRFAFWRTKQRPELGNANKKIKEVMHLYNTDRLALYLTKNETDD
jgi:hypothetical protein